MLSLLSNSSATERELRGGGSLDVNRGLEARKTRNKNATARIPTSKAVRLPLRPRLRSDLAKNSRRKRRGTVKSQPAEKSKTILPICSISPIVFQNISVFCLDTREATAWG